MDISGKAKYHILAIVTAMIWGTTFVSSKILLNEGLSPADIMLYRFVLAYFGILVVSHKRLFANSLKDELLMVAAGITGGSLYFLVENTGLQYTQASNAAIIIAITPLLVTIASHFFGRRERVRRQLVIGSLFSFAGVVLVVLNGRFELQLSPKGDLLIVGAAVLWTLYSLVIYNLEGRYDITFVTRKVFFYGIITLLPAFAFRPLNTDLKILMQPIVAGNLIYLGIIASLLAYIWWNVAVAGIGSVKATNYLYLNPVVSIITALVVLQERITAIAIVGVAMIVGGIWLSEGRLHRKRTR